MPRLSDAMEQGTIVRWLKDVGDQVEVGDELVEVETDKATVIYEAEISGLLSEILVQAGEAQQLGGPIARIGGTVVAAPAPGGPPATPVARRRASELGVDLATLTGTGPRGRIRLADVEAAADRPPAHDRQPAAAPTAPAAPAPRTAPAPSPAGGRGAAERLP